MAKINFLTAYPTATPVASSIVIGSIASGGATNNFLMSDIAAYVMSAPVSTITLQQVCDQGAVTTTGITVGGAVDINNTADISDTLTLSKPTGTGLSVTSNASVGGTLGVTGVSTLGEIDASGVADIANTLTLSKATGTGLSVTADVSVGGDLFVDSIESDAANLIIKDAGSVERIRVGVSGALTFQGDSTFTEDLVALGTVPASSSATGTKGAITSDANYIYVCTATDTWKRVAIAW